MDSANVAGDSYYTRLVSGVVSLYDGTAWNVIPLTGSAAAATIISAAVAEGGTPGQLQLTVLTNAGVVHQTTCTDPTDVPTTCGLFTAVS